MTSAQPKVEAAYGHQKNKRFERLAEWNVQIGASVKRQQPA